MFFILIESLLIVKNSVFYFINYLSKIYLTIFQVSSAKNNSHVLLKTMPSQFHDSNLIVSVIFSFSKSYVYKESFLSDII